MGKWLFRAVVALAIVVPLSAIAFLVGMRYVDPTPAQKIALARMSAPTPPVQGHDASDAIWLLDDAVPSERMPEAAAARRRQAQLRSPRSGSSPAPVGEYARYPGPPKDAPCGEAEAGCLAYVSEHRAEVAALLAAHRPGIDAARALAAYDGFRLGVPPTLELEYPRMTARRRLVLADMAYRFAAGERLSAVEGVCRDIAGWRRIGGNADDLVVSMVGAANVRSGLVLLADMLARMPKETDLPEACGAALESSADYEFDLCPSLRSEFQAQRDLRSQYVALGGDSPPAWMIDWKNFEAMVAEDFARFCDPAVTGALREDQLAAEITGSPPECTTWRQRADPVGCGLMAVGRPDWGMYLDRRADQAQMLALMRAVVWLRAAAESPAEVESVLAARPRELGLLRAPAYERENDRLSIPLHYTARGDRFVLAAGAEPRPTRARHRPGARRSRGLAFVD